MASCGYGEAAHCGHANYFSFFIPRHKQVRILLSDDLVYYLPVGLARGGEHANQSFYLTEILVRTECQSGYLHICEYFKGESRKQKGEIFMK
jgi:hypothetical protein